MKKTTTRRLPADTLTELREQLLRELSKLNSDGAAAEPDLCRAYLRQAQILVWKGVAQGDFQAPREALDLILEARPFAQAHRPEPRDTPRVIAEDIQTTLRSLYLAEQALEPLRVEARLADRKRSSTEREVLSVLRQNLGQYLCRGDVNEKLDPESRPTRQRIGQVLDELFQEGLLLRRHGRTQGSPEASFYALGPRGVELCGRLGSLPRELSINREMVQVASLVMPGELVIGGVPVIFDGVVAGSKPVRKLLSHNAADAPGSPAVTGGEGGWPLADRTAQAQKLSNRDPSLGWAAMDTLKLGTLTELREQLVRELNKLSCNAAAAELDLCRSYLRQAQVLVWKRVAQGDFQAPREALDLFLDAQPFAEAHTPEAADTRSEIAEEIQATLRSLYLAEEALEPLRAEARLADRKRSTTKREVLSVLRENLGQYLCRSDVHEKLDPESRPTRQRIGQVLDESFQEGLLLRRHGRTQGNPEASFYALGPRGVELFGQLGSEPRELSIGLGMVQAASPGIPGELAIGGDDLLVFNGINASTGGPLFPPVSAHEVFAAIQRKPRSERPKPLSSYVDPCDLSQTGWGVIVHRDEDPRVVEALAPLLRFREERAERLYAEFLGPDKGYVGQTKKQFLAAVEIGNDPVDPERLPYYLLLVGDPTRISYDFQQSLDVQYAVGRVCFDSPDEYRRYAESVVAAESGSPLRPRKAALWAVRTAGDLATKLSADHLVGPLWGGFQEAQWDGWETSASVADRATKARLRSLLGGADTPAVLFTASHGVGFERRDPRQRDQQGALLCQDWPGPAHVVDEAHYLCANDVASNANVHGLIAFFFACHGVGVPRVDEFAQYERRRRPRPLTAEPFVARLPQRLLTHPNGGALAVIGQVDRAWAFSFLCTNGGSQIGAFTRVLELLMKGFPVGCAMESFNLKYAAISADLTHALQRRYYRERVSEQEIANLWAANNDARSYCVVGDPAVRVAV